MTLQECFDKVGKIPFKVKHDNWAKDDRVWTIEAQLSNGDFIGVDVSHDTAVSSDYPRTGWELVE